MIRQIRIGDGSLTVNGLSLKIKGEDFVLNHKEIESRLVLCKERREFNGIDLGKDALAKHDALLEIYHLLGGEGEPEDVVEACKKQAASVMDDLSMWPQYRT